MESSEFSNSQPIFEAVEQLESQGGTCDCFRVKLYGKLHFVKRLKPEFVGDIRHQEALRKEFETGYRLEHPHIARYISLTGDGILMEYVDGETLAQRLDRHPEYFTKQSTDKLLRQLLDALGYLHAHQVLHLDLKPDNILLTRINDDVKLIDLGCCYTDTFADTQGHTNAFAAPEQLAGGNVDERTDIYAIGKMLQRLPTHHHYGKVIARCMADSPAERYQSVEEVVKALSIKRKPYLMALAAALAIAIVVAAFLLGHQTEDVSEITGTAEDPVSVLPPIAPQEPDGQETVANPVPTTQQTLLLPSASVSRDTPQTMVPDGQDSVASPVPAPQQTRPTPAVSISKDTPQTMSPDSQKPVVNPIPVPQQTVSASKDTPLTVESELDNLIDAAYRSTIASFCDSVFPSLSVGKAWSKQSSEFHVQVLQAGADVYRRHPDVPESIIFQLLESRFHNLTSYVFNRMRENGQR